MPASLPVLRKCFSSILCAETQLTRVNGSGIPRWYLFINLGWVWQTGKQGRRGGNFWLMGTSLTNMSLQSLKQTLQAFCLFVCLFTWKSHINHIQTQTQTIGSPVYTGTGTLNSFAKINWIRNFLAIWWRIWLMITKLFCFIISALMMGFIFYSPSFVLSLCLLTTTDTMFSFLGHLI